MNNLANSYFNLGRHVDALKLCEETLAARKRVLPANHPDTLSSMNNLAMNYEALGRHADALKLFEETLAAYKRVLPADHPDTLISMNNLAGAYAFLGRHADALKLREETLAARKRVLGADHPDTLSSMGSGASSLVKLDRGAEAVPLIRAAVARWEKLDRRDADSLYKAAVFRAVASAAQAKAGGAEASKLAAEDADQAMAWLTKAVAAGYKDRADIEKDTDLDALRGRADFKKLLEALPPPATAPAGK